MKNCLSKSIFPYIHIIWTTDKIWPSELNPNPLVCRLHTCSSCFWCCFLILLYPVNCSFSSLVCSCSLNCFVTIDVGRIVAKLLVSGSLRPLAWDNCKSKKWKFKTYCIFSYIFIHVNEIKALFSVFLLNHCMFFSYIFIHVIEI